MEKSSRLLSQRFVSTEASHDPLRAASIVASEGGGSSGSIFVTAAANISAVKVMLEACQQFGELCPGIG